MEIVNNTIEKEIKLQMKKSQILFWISVIVSIAVVLYKRQYVYWGFYFALLAVLALPNINKCKKDLYDFRRNFLSQTHGKAIDIFKEDENDENSKWILILQDTNTNSEVDFVFAFNPGVDAGEEICIYHTNILKIPVRVEKIIDKK